jgi:hypothetical protein
MWLTLEVDDSWSRNGTMQRMNLGEVPDDVDAVLVAGRAVGLCAPIPLRDTLALLLMQESAAFSQSGMWSVDP